MGDCAEEGETGRYSSDGEHLCGFFESGSGLDLWMVRWVESSSELELELLDRLEICYTFLALCVSGRVGL